LGPEPAEFTIASVAGIEAPNVLDACQSTAAECGNSRFVHAQRVPDFPERGAQPLADIGLEDAWVLGRATVGGRAVPNPGEVMQQSQQITRLYLTEYAKMWQEYLADVRLIPRNGLAETIQVTRVSGQCRVAAAAVDPCCSTRDHTDPNGRQLKHPS
jgi:type VI secretion system protein ImpL